MLFQIRYRMLFGLVTTTTVKHILEIMEPNMNQSEKNLPTWVLETYNSPYADVVVKTMQRISRAHDYALGGDWDESYKLMRRFHKRGFPFDDMELWAKHYGAEVWHDPDDIYDIGWFTVDDDGGCELRDAAKVYLHFEMLNAQV